MNGGVLVAGVVLDVSERSGVKNDRPWTMKSVDIGFMGGHVEATVREGNVPASVVVGAEVVALVTLRADQSRVRADLVKFLEGPEVASFFRSGPAAPARGAA